ncbi:hypothetical protein JAAARDRAFT_31518 [Jaapia argillacea MUCL 33604]|uniref:Chromatin modification-related protein n=1 Tax=Jaapia argillacea MUCL 33604 TaxID=933084 RepID=A0A067QD83_9AGAM|nr:hypothetical protein JAAARDRAFT_31518 [Jaapia argillacea MUCL 33604]
MSYKSASRKRRRSHRYGDEPFVENPPVVASGDEEIVDTARLELQGPDNPDDGAAAEGLAKRLEIWDALREEHYETVEQLPLSLHRSFTLLRELEEQVQAHDVDLRSSLQKYIEMRISLAGRTPDSAMDPDIAMDDASNGDGPNRTVEKSTKMEAECDEVPPLHSSHLPSSTESPTLLQLSRNQQSIPSTPSFPIPSPFLSDTAAQPPQTTRALLSRVAVLSEEVVRATQEKVNLAQAAYDTIDRHIRLLDQVVQEQETSLSLGLRPGTHPTPLVLPRSARPPPRTVHTPPPEDGANAAEGDTQDVEGGGLTAIPSEGAESQIAAIPRRGKKGRSRKKSDVHNLPRSTVKSIKLTVSDDVEERYCYCNEISFGDMIACDNRNCKREWFHWPCVGLTEAPRGKWYCRDCQK